MQYSFENIHEVPTAVFYCLDPRFRKQHVQFIEQELGFNRFDAYVVPGGPRVLVQEETRSIFLGNIERVSISLHHISEMILIAHRDCGAYGGSKAFPNPDIEKATQVEDLKLARRILLEKFPQLKVRMYYLEIIGNKVEFQSI